MLLSSLFRLEPQAVSLRESLGRVLAQEVVAAADIPPFATAAMDGYAVRAADTAAAPSHLLLAGTITAGRLATVRLGPGQAMAITTGAPVPDGADSICRVESAQADGLHVVLAAPVAVGENVRRPGEEVARNSMVFEASTVVGPAHIGVLASFANSEITVYPKARVGVLSVGDELREGTAALGPGEVRDSNRPALLALAQETGCDPVDLGIVPDDASAIGEAIERAAHTCDVVITSGGASVGIADHMKSVLGRLSGASAQWMEIAMRPGKPFGFAVLADSRTPVLCLPGSPAAAMVSFEMVARPALRYMMGHQVLHRAMLEATAEERLPSAAGSGLRIVRVVARADDSGCLQVRAAGGQGSYNLRSMALANALAFLSDGTGIDAGESVRIALLDADSLRPADPDHRQPLQHRDVANGVVG